MLSRRFFLASAAATLAGFLGLRPALYREVVISVRHDATHFSEAISCLGVVLEGLRARSADRAAEAVQVIRNLTLDRVAFRRRFFHMRILSRTPTACGTAVIVSLEPNDRFFDLVAAVRAGDVQGYVVGNAV